MPRPGDHDEPVGHSRVCQRGGQLLRLADRHQRIIGSMNQESRRVARAHLVHRRGRRVAAGHGRWRPAQELRHGFSRQGTGGVKCGRSVGAEKLTTASTAAESAELAVPVQG